MLPLMTTSPWPFLIPKYLGLDLRLLLETPAAFFVAQRFSTRLHGEKCAGQQRCQRQCRRVRSRKRWRTIIVEGEERRIERGGGRAEGERSSRCRSCGARERNDVYRRASRGVPEASDERGCAAPRVHPDVRAVTGEPTRSVMSCGAAHSNGIAAHRHGAGQGACRVLLPSGKHVRTLRRLIVSDTGRRHHSSRARLSPRRPPAMDQGVHLSAHSGVLVCRLHS